jgi:ATP-dependent DNA helicase PIF1
MLMAACGYCSPNATDSDSMQAPLVLSEEFQYILDLLEKTPSSLFLTGKAGTGKSTLLNLFRSTTRKRVAVVAPTGVAALNVQGQTIHSFFGFPPRIVTPQEASHKVSRKDLQRLYKNLQILIIDEISMVRADVLDGMDRFLRVNRENYRPFGGVQVVMVGDLFQLPPVVNRDPIEQAYFTEYYETPYFFSAKVLQEPDFLLDKVELSKVYRQESRLFLRLLQAVRVNELDYDDLEDLNERYQPNYAPEPGYITLCARNATADRINRDELGKLSTPIHKYMADVSGNFDANLYPTELELSLREGAQVMFVKNDPDKNFVNGTIGIIEALGKEHVHVRIKDEAGRSKLIDVARMEWQILRYRSDVSGGIEAESVGTFLQYPLKLAWGITIHKSQGKTFDQVLLDLGTGAFEHGQLYVALSRCRTLEGIVLRQKIRPQDVITDERVVAFYDTIFR